MVAFSTLVLGLSVFATSLAAPTTEPVAQIESRGPHNFILGAEDAILGARGNVSARANSNYVQDYTTGGTVDFSHSGNSFSLSYNTKEDFVVGIGWSPGSTSPIKYSGSFGVTSGLGTLSVYGWSTNPLVEYYVIENSVGFTQTGTKKGTFTSDGATYVIWENVRTNAPSIQGTKTFNQYISVRQSKRSSGTVTIANHFNAWKSHGMSLGTLNYQVIAVESWNGVGSAKQTISN